jgi:hypothetical protein
MHYFPLMLPYILTLTRNQKAGVWASQADGKQQTELSKLLGRQLTFLPQTRPGKVTLPSWSPTIAD